MPKPIRIALVGAGIFMRENHAPALQSLPEDFEVVGIYSRTLESAKRVAAVFNRPIDLYTNLDTLLAHDGVDALDIALPIDLMPNAVKLGLAAGKHILSEKPAAADLASGRALLEFAAHMPGQTWMVAENWRHEPCFVEARKLIDAGQIGAVQFASWLSTIRMDSSNPYYGTAWRREPTYQGGFLLDIGVHQVAAWRLLFGEVKGVNALAVSVKPDLPPLDTLSGSLVFESGMLANYAVSFAAFAPVPSPLDVFGSTGTLRIDRSAIEILGDGKSEKRPMWDVHPRANVTMFKEFAAVVRGEKAAPVGTALNAVKDVAVVEAVLRSGRSGRPVAVEAV